MEDKSGEPKIALFIDLDNLALGVREAKYQKFEIQKVLERLREKGKLVVKRAYADWDSFSEYKRSFHEAAVE
ncbi:MAG: NYN domain-containing protein, partial [Acidobacteria bacterium]|nr:NYN domain-containing protein [Acidobacteriota bacterium]